MFSTQEKCVHTFFQTLLNVCVLPLLFIAISFLCVLLSNKTKKFIWLLTNRKFAFYEISQRWLSYLESYLLPKYWRLYNQLLTGLEYSVHVIEKKKSKLSARSILMLFYFFRLMASHWEYEHMISPVILGIQRYLKRQNDKIYDPNYGDGQSIARWFIYKWKLHWLKQEPAGITTHSFFFFGGRGEDPPTCLLAFLSLPLHQGMFKWELLYTP